MDEKISIAGFFFMAGMAVYKCIRDMRPRRRRLRRRYPNGRYSYRSKRISPKDLKILRDEIDKLTS